MHPLLFVAGVGVSAAGLIARSFRRDKRMWEALEDAAGSKAYVTTDWRRRREVAFPTGVTFVLSGGQGGEAIYLTVPGASRISRRLARNISTVCSVR